MRGVAAHPAESAQGANTQATGFIDEVCVTTKGDQLALDVGCQGAGQLQRIALAAAE
jgi:hypothetical protein